MRVVHISTAHKAFDGRIFQKELRTLASAGYDTTFMVHHDKRATRDGVRIEPLGTYDSRAERMSSVLTAYRRARSIDADVYHFHDPELLPVGVALSRRTDAKVIYDVHEDYDRQIQFKEWIPAVVRPVLERSIVPVQSACASQFDGLVAANEWIGETFARRGHDVTVVGNFPITNDIEIEDYSNRRDHEYVLSYVGNVDGNRGFRAMIEVTHRLRERGYDVGLWVIGPVDPELSSWADTYTRKHGLTDAVELFGYVDYTDVFSYLHASDVGMMLVDPDMYEYGLSNKMFEYMYAELPVAAHETVATRKYVPEECGVHVEDPDREAQTDAVARLLDRPQSERDEMGVRGRQHVLENCSWENEGERLVEMYETL